MFEDYESDSNEEQTRHVCGSIADLRDHVLMIFGGFIAKISDTEPAPAECSLAYQRQFLELWEVENIVREHSDVQTDGAYGIGANSFEEYQTKMLGLFRSLGGRVLSNVMRRGVAEGLLDAEYDFERDEFNFSITEKGMTLVNPVSESNDTDSGEASRSDSSV
jgi:hypothetical protein